MSTILIVEDNFLNRDMLSRRLIRRGFTIVMAEDGKKGIEKARELRPDLILMDMSLPEISGWDATRALKADAFTRSIPVIALTAHAMAEDRKRAFDAGCDDYDTKPVDFQRLLSKIQSFLAEDA